MKKKNLNDSLRSLEKTIIKNRNRIFLILVSLLFLIFLLNSFFTISSGYTLNKKILEIKEFNEPINLSLSIIDCNECFNVSSIVDSIKNKNVNILQEKSFDKDSNQAKELISKYNIKKLPSIIITGEINSSKVNFNNFELKDDALILNKTNAPYFDMASNKINGKVEIFEIVDSSCKECVKLSSIPLSFAKLGVLISDWKKIEYNSNEGKKLINKFGIKEIPSVLISTEINYYKDLRDSLSKLGLNEKQGFYILHATQPPYRDLSKNKITGLVNLIMLTDKSCASCYNVSINKQILNRFGMVIQDEKTYDVSSPKGKLFVSKYDIQKVPIIILSSEAGKYDSFVRVWKSVGSVESDGWFVMRSPEALGTIKNIVNNTIIGTRK